MITGTVLGRGVAATQGRVTVDYALVKPEKSAQALAELAIESRRWRATSERYWELVGAGRLNPDVAKRASFAEEVLAHAGETIRIGGCCVILAQATDGRILGVNISTTKDHDGYLDLQATDPDHLPTAPGVGQLRGIGTALVSAAVQDLLAKGIDTLYLKPLDAEAARFWRGRGFMPCGGSLLCVRGRQAIEGLRGGCERQPDCPDQNGECLICGLPSDTEAMRLPTRRRYA